MIDYTGTRCDIVYLVQTSVSRDQILRRKRGERNIHFPSSVDHEQDWQPYQVDPYSKCDDHAYSHISLYGVMGSRKVTQGL